ncbi:MAG: hypothetical protein M1822_004674 [Bathelium mastoideum]|nr:MAG: hypothetical protein M1822_004674 [Bathelium mastoideum]
MSAQITRTRIVLSAADRITVREVYAAALDAGAIPSQPPEYRNSGDFGAAVFDFDGNVIEAVFPGDGPANSGSAAPRNGSILTWKQDDAKSAVSAAKSQAGASSRASHVSAAKSQSAPARSEEDGLGQTLATALLGAAAGAAIAYGWSKYDDDKWKKESAAAKSEAESHFAKKERSVRDGQSEMRSAVSAGPARSIARSQTLPSVAPPPSQSVRAIEAAPPKSTVSQRSARTARAIEAAPSQVSESRSVARSVRASEAPAPPKSTVSSRHAPTVVSAASRRSGKSENRSRVVTEVIEEEVLVPVPGPARSATMPAASVAGVSHMINEMRDAYERANKLYSEVQNLTAANIPLPASKPASVATQSQHMSAVDVPLPASKPASVAAQSQRMSAVDVPLPSSKASSHVSHRSNYHSAVEAAPARSGASQIAEPVNPELPGSDREKILDDLETLVPDDSASNIGCSPPPERRRHRSRSRRSRHSDLGHSRGLKQDGYEYVTRSYISPRGSDVSTLKPWKRHGRRDSGVSLPVRLTVRLK